MVNLNTPPNKPGEPFESIVKPDIVSDMLNFLESSSPNRYKVPYLIKELYDHFTNLYHHPGSMTDIIIGTNTSTPIPKPTRPPETYSEINLDDYVYLNYRPDTLNGIINNVNLLNPILLKKNLTIAVINIDTVIYSTTLYKSDPISIPILFKSLKDMGDNLSGGDMFNRIKQQFVSKITELISMTHSYGEFVKRMVKPDPFEIKLITIMANTKSKLGGYFPGMWGYLGETTDMLGLQKYLGTAIYSVNLYDFHYFLSNRLFTLPKEFKNENGTLDEAPDNSLKKLKTSIEPCILVILVLIKAIGHNYSLDYATGYDYRGIDYINKYYNRPVFFFLLQQIINNTLKITDAAFAPPDPKANPSDWMADPNNKPLIQLNKILPRYVSLYTTRSEGNPSRELKYIPLTLDTSAYYNTEYRQGPANTSPRTFQGEEYKGELFGTVHYYQNTPLGGKEQPTVISNIYGEKGCIHYSFSVTLTTTDTTKMLEDYSKTYNDEPTFYNYVYSFLKLLPETQFIDLNTIKEKAYSENIKAQDIIDEMNIKSLTPIPSPFSKVGDKINTTGPAIEPGKNIIFIEDSTIYEVRTIPPPPNNYTRSYITTSIDKSDIITINITEPSVIVLIKPSCSSFNIVYKPYQMPFCGEMVEKPVFNIPPKASSELFGFIPNIIKIPDTTSRTTIMAIIFLFIVTGGLVGYTFNALLDLL